VGCFFVLFLGFQLTIQLTKETRNDRHLVS